MKNEFNKNKGTTQGSKIIKIKGMCIQNTKILDKARVLL